MNDFFSFHSFSDIYGNVWEWCDDWLDEYKDTKVLRGGSWNSNADITESSNRIRFIPADSVSGFGFRLQRTLDS